MIKKYDISGTSEYKSFQRLIREFKFGPGRLTRHITSNETLQTLLSECLTDEDASNPDKPVEEKVRELYDILITAYKHYYHNSKEDSVQVDTIKPYMDIGITTVYKGSSGTFGYENIDVQDSYFEAYCYLECIEGEVTRDNKDSISCMLKDYELGEDLLDIFFPSKKKLPWSFYSVDKTHVISVDEKKDKKITTNNQSSEWTTENYPTDNRQNYENYRRQPEKPVQKEEKNTAKTLDEWFRKLDVNITTKSQLMSEVNDGIYRRIITLTDSNIFTFLDKVVETVSIKGYRITNAPRLKQFQVGIQSIYTLLKSSSSDNRRIKREIVNEVQALIEVFESAINKNTTKPDAYGNTPDDKERLKTDIAIDNFILQLLSGLNRSEGLRLTGGARQKTRKNRKIQRRTRNKR
jgi:hypothetical protein